MLIVALAACLSSTADEPPPPRVRLDDYIAEVCADAPDGSCMVLYALVDLLDLVMQGGATEAGSWCCKTCTPGGDKGPKVTCDGCLTGGKSFECGGPFKFADRPVHLDCTGTTTQQGERVICY